MNNRENSTLPVANRMDWTNVTFETDYRKIEPLPLNATAFDKFCKQSAPKVQRAVKPSHCAPGVRW